LNDNTLGFIVFLVLIGSWCGVWAAWNWARTLRRAKQLDLSLHWPLVKATVTSTETVWAHFEVSYEYTADDKSYAGLYKANLPVTPYRGFAAATRLIAAAKILESDFAKGQSVWVKYDPEIPDHSILIRKIDPA
jgi:hypothetical protein